MRKWLLIIGAIFLLLALFWPWLGKIPLGRLPGDLVIRRPGMQIYIPFTTMLLLSILLSLFFWLFRKWF